jgi:transglutaminase-like putative cysteine protease
MSTKAVLQDSVVVNVPSGLPYLVIRFPLLQSPSCGSDEAPSNYQLINSENILCSVDPSNVKNVQDESGNSYRELTYKNPPAGQITIQAKTGQIDIAANLSKPLPDVNLPISSNDMPSCVSKFLLPSRYVQSDSPDIQELAQNIVGNTKSESQAAKKISYWLRQNLQYGGSMMLKDTDALSVMHNKYSICCGWAHLFIALARASGIPARFVGGYVIAGSFTYPTSTDGLDRVTTFNTSLMHAWVELWYPNQGWVAYDPQSSAGFVDTHHIRLWTSIDGGSTLPLVTWESIGKSPDVTFTETENASDVTDQLDMHCIGRQGDRLAGPIMLSR